jgi:hypothetical protein
VQVRKLSDELDEAREELGTRPPARVAAITPKRAPAKKRAAKRSGAA